MTRRLLLVGPLVGLACCSLTAQAAPVDRSRRADARVQLALGRGRTLDLSIALTAGRLRVETQRCDPQGCAMSEAWSGSVAGGSVDASQPRAQLHASVDGLPLSVSWSPHPSQGPAVVVGGLDGTGGPQGDSTAAYEADPADVRFTLDDQTCTGTGSVGDEVRVSDSPSDGAAPLSDLELPDGVLSC